ncbi:MAG: MFS transporter [Candidatus Komeilibacteria bacterium]
MKSYKTFRLLFIAGFLLALSTALPAYIQSSFLEDYMDIQMVSLYLTGVMALTLIALFIYPRIINKITNLRALLLTSVISIASLLLLGIAKQPVAIIVLFTIQYITLMLLVINTDIALENISDDEHTGRIRGRHLTILNVGWLISPLLMGFIVTLGGYQSVYLVAGIIMFSNLLLIYMNRKLITDHKEYHVHKLRNLLKSLSKNNNLRKIFALSFVLRFFFCLMVLYTPIYLNRYIGFDWETISIIFTIMLLPFVLFGMPAGQIADRWLGEKEIMFTGLILMMVTTGIMFFYNVQNAVIWAILLFIGRIGAAIVEAMQESYFFKHVDGDDLDLVSLFRDVRPFAWLIGTGLSAIILHFLPIQYIFIFLAFVILLSLYPALTIKDTK